MPYSPKFSPSALKNLGLRIGILVFIVCLSLHSAVVGQVGTQLAKIIVPVPSPSGVAIGVDVDCNGNLYYTNSSSAFLYKIDKNGTLLATVPMTDASTGGAISFGAISWDNTRQKLWAGTDNSGSPADVYLIDPATGVSVFQFTIFSSGVGFIDGIAFDQSDNTVWISDDVANWIDHFQDNGVYLNTLIPSVANSVSGVVVGKGNLLYLGQGSSGQIVKVTKTTGSFISSFSSPGGRDEDLACDQINFAPKLALWSKDAYNDSLTAIEVDTGTCVCGQICAAPPTSAFSSSPACLGNAVTLTDGSISPSGDPITQWSWSMPGGAPATSANPTTSTSYLTSGTHTVTLTVTTQAGCTSSISQQVVVYTPPVANFSGSGTGCAPVCVNNYTDLSTSTDGNITNWAWSFPGGTPSSYNTTVPPGNPGSICYNTAGTYGAALTVTTQYGCDSTITITPIVTPRPWPDADFCLDPNNQASAADPVFNFCDLWSNDVTSGGNWVWDFGDGTATLSGSGNVNTDPVHSYSASIATNDFYKYDVCLRVENQYGCRDSICKTIEILPEYTFYMPNTFTPNSDHMNELFYGKGIGVKDYNIWLFDRWGNMIWDCHYSGKNTAWDSEGQEGMPSACKWDGKVAKGGIDMSGGSNQLAQEDVYVWKVKLTDAFDQKHTYVGHVNIVK